MPLRESLPQFYAQHLLPYSPPKPAAQPQLPQEPQSFYVFPIATGSEMPALPYGRRDFYHIALYLSGSTHLEYPAHSLRLDQPALLLYNPLAAYSCTPFTPLSGYCCLYTTEFLDYPGHSVPWLESPLFQLGASPVLLLTNEQATFLAGIFQQLLAAAHSTYHYRLDLLRTYVNLLLHEALRLQPPRAAYPPAPASATHRLTAQFLTLLQQQFPIDSLNQPLELRTAHDYAAALGVHVNYLNRAVRVHTGRTTTQQVQHYVLREAKRQVQLATWSIADIAYALGFESPTYFTNFFKKQLGFPPTTLRS